MMKSVGIVGEYNPFHQGHKYLVDQAKQMTGAEICVSIMSGNFVQRGEPAVYNKWIRAGIAVDNGVNLVIELPSIFACNSAEYFARGSIEILEGFGCIDYLAFGSESGDLDKLNQGATFLMDKDQEIHSRVQEFMRMGNSYPRARQMAVEQIHEDFDLAIINEPNNILAIEYLKQIKTMKPITVQRRGDDHHQCASQIRRDMITADPKKFQLMNQKYFDLVRAKILQMDLDKLEKIFSTGEGLASKLKKELRYATSTEDFIGRIKSKAYTYTRISRLLTHVLLDIDIDAMEEAQPYIRVLAFDQVGAKFLKEIKGAKCATIPVLTNVNKEIKEFPTIKKGLEKDFLAADIYNIINGENLYENSDYVAMPCVKK